MSAQLDHLVLVTADLDAGMAELEEVTGLRPVPGGAHPGRGTRNALLGLTWRGQDGPAYLELLGPDPEQPQVRGEAMMLDLGARLDAGLDQRVRTHTWLVRPADLDATLARAAEVGVDVGVAVEASRQTPDGVLLRWRLAVPRPLGLGGVQPSLIDWGGGAHPSDADLPVVELVDLRVQHPDPDGARTALEALGVEQPVEPGARPQLTVHLRTPAGPVVLS